MRKGFTVASAVMMCFGLAAGLGWSQAPEDDDSDPKRSGEPNQVSEFMRAKLEHSQKVLEGLATEDYKMIARHSQELSLLSLAAQWNVLQTPEYAEQSAEFRRSVDAISKAAKKKNLDGAALAYMATTIKCVECHKHVRGVRMAKADTRPSN